MQLPPLDDEAVANSEGGKSSRTSGWTICAMTGCDYLSFIICMISLTSAGGSSTSAFAAAKGLSSTMATSISPPSFLMSADRPACILFKIATAKYTFPTLLSLFAPAIQFVVGPSGHRGCPARGEMHCLAT